MKRSLQLAFPLFALLLGAAAMQAQQHWFEITRHRMDVDVDGAPTAYGPRGYKTLDTLRHAHVGARMSAPVVGYMTEHDKPIVQGPNDPAPGYYVSQTTFEDDSLPDHDPRRYVNAAKINYVVLGNEAKRRGARVGDFVAVHSKKTGSTVFGIVADTGNASGDEGSLHLLQSLGYPFIDGRRQSVERAGEIIVRYFPHSNPQHRFFHTQAALDAAAEKLGLNDVFRQEDK